MRAFSKAVVILSAVIAMLVCSSFTCFARIFDLPNSTWSTVIGYSPSVYHNLDYLTNDDVEGYKEPTFIPSNGAQLGNPEFNNLDRCVMYYAFDSATRVEYMTASITIGGDYLKNEYNNYTNDGFLFIRFNLYLRAYDDVSREITPKIKCIASMSNEGGKTIGDPITFTSTYIPTGAENLGKGYLIEGEVPYLPTNEGTPYDIELTLTVTPQYGEYLRFTGSNPAITYSFFGLSAIHVNNVGQPSANVPRYLGHVISVGQIDGLGRFYYLKSAEPVTGALVDPYTGTQFGYLPSSSMDFHSPLYPEEFYRYYPEVFTNGSVTSGWLYKGIEVDYDFYMSWLLNGAGDYLEEYLRGFTNGYEMGALSERQNYLNLKAQYEQLLNQFGTAADDMYTLGYENGYKDCSASNEEVTKVIDEAGQLASIVVPDLLNVGIMGITLGRLIFCAVAVVICIIVFNLLRS